MTKFTDALHEIIDTDLYPIHNLNSLTYYGRSTRLHEERELIPVDGLTD